MPMTFPSSVSSPGTIGRSSGLTDPRGSSILSVPMIHILLVNCGFSFLNRCNSLRSLVLSYIPYNRRGLFNRIFGFLLPRVVRPDLANEERHPLTANLQKPNPQFRKGFQYPRHHNAMKTH